MMEYKGINPEVAKAESRHKPGPKKLPTYLSLGKRVFEYKKKIFAAMEAAKMDNCPAKAKFVELIDPSDIPKGPQIGTPPGNRSLARMFSFGGSKN